MIKSYNVDGKTVRLFYTNELIKRMKDRNISEILLLQSINVAIPKIIKKIKPHIKIVVIRGRKSKLNIVCEVRFSKNIDIVIVTAIVKSGFHKTKYTDTEIFINPNITNGRPINFVVVPEIEEFLRYLIKLDIVKRFKRLHKGDGYHFVTDAVDYIVEYDGNQLVVPYAKWTTKTLIITVP